MAWGILKGHMWTIIWRNPQSQKCKMTKNARSLGSQVLWVLFRFRWMNDLCNRNSEKFLPLDFFLSFSFSEILSFKNAHFWLWVHLIKITTVDGKYSSLINMYENTINEYLEYLIKPMHVNTLRRGIFWFSIYQTNTEKNCNSNQNFKPKKWFFFIKPLILIKTLFWTINDEAQCL